MLMTEKDGIGLDVEGRISKLLKCGVLFAVEVKFLKKLFGLS